MNQIERITLMESYFDDSYKAIRSLEASLKEYMNIQDKLRELSIYYVGGEWLQDFDDDNAGLLPCDLKRGVLSEDAVYDLMNDNRELCGDVLCAMGEIMRAGKI